MEKTMTSIRVDKHKKELLQQRGIKLTELVNTAINIAVQTYDYKNIERDMLLKEISLKERELADLRLRLELLDRV